uniref:Uncharacterized protein n=1 Tax=Tanacetum cinerariifolium TaxID=118510 RepID=A0A6L2J7P1_TANCI|nr:hypothetical protein [Tanacetum cinerariifolium]
MVNEGIGLDAGLDSEASTNDNTSTEQQKGSNSSGHAVDAKRARVDKVVSDKETVAVRSLSNNDTLTKTEFFKTPVESTMSESYSDVYKNEMFEENSSLESENRCLKRPLPNFKNGSTLYCS